MVIDISNSPSPPPVVGVGSRSDLSSPTVSESLPPPVRDDKIIEMINKNLSLIKQANPTVNMLEIMAKYNYDFDTAKNFNDLQSAVVAFCRRSKTSDPLGVLYQLLYKWMRRNRKLIPSTILRRMANQISHFSKYKHVLLFHRASGYLIVDPEYSLNYSAHGKPTSR